MHVTIMHNAAQDEHGRNLGYLDGYLPDHPLLRVFTFTLSGHDTKPMSESAQRYNDERVLDNVFHVFNVGDDPNFGDVSPLAVAYRAKRLRSLSVGDVVLLDGRAYCCSNVGWLRLADDGPASPEQVRTHVNACYQ